MKYIRFPKVGGCKLSMSTVLSSLSTFLPPMVSCLISWFVCAKDTSFSQTIQAININKKPDKTAESHLRITSTGYTISVVERKIWRQVATASVITLLNANFSTANAPRGKAGRLRQHIRSGQSRNDLSLNQNPALINKPYFIKFSIISLLFTATRTTMHRLKRPA